MKLSYRGANYEFTAPSLEVTDGEILGKYRGVTWHCQTLKEMPIPQTHKTLYYRGVAYNASQGSSGSVAPTAATGAVMTKPVVVPRAFPIRKQAEQIHRANLLRNLERRIQVAKERGDQQLVNLLEAESRQLV